MTPPTSGAGQVGGGFTGRGDAEARNALVDVFSPTVGVGLRTDQAVSPAKDLASDLAKRLLNQVHAGIPSEGCPADALA